MRSPPGRGVSTVGGCSPVASAVVAAFAAAAAQVPVVQPVRSAFGRTFIVRGRSGSRSSGRFSPDAASATRRLQLLPGTALGSPEPVEVPGVVQVRAGAAGGQGRTDQNQRVL